VTLAVVVYGIYTARQLRQSQTRPQP